MVTRGQARWRSRITIQHSQSKAIRTILHPISSIRLATSRNQYPVSQARQEQHIAQMDYMKECCINNSEMSVCTISHHTDHETHFSAVDLFYPTKALYRFTHNLPYYALSQSRVCKSTEQVR